MLGRVVIATLCLISCKRADDTHVAPEPAPVVALPDAVAIDAAPIDAAGVDVELLHAVPATIAVSSTVANATIVPAMIADGDPATAWNSRTDDIWSAWVAFRLPADAHVTSIRMTAGFTATDRDDDYFTMNRRITRVRVTRLGEPGDLGTHDLDVDDRTLQTIPIDAPGGDFRIQVVMSIPGTQVRWREIAISELEVWGSARGAKANTLTPTFTIGSLGAKPLEDVDDDLVPVPAVASIQAFCAANAKRPATTIVQPIPVCGEPAAGPDLSLPAGWTSSYFATPWGARDVGCNLAIVVDGATYVVDNYATSGCGNRNRWSMGMCELRHETIVAGARVAIITTRAELPYSLDMIGILPDVLVEEVRVCGTRDGVVACSAPVEIGNVTCNAYGDGPPGADGLTIDETGWRREVTFVRGRLRLGDKEDAGAKYMR